MTTPVIPNRYERLLVYVFIWTVIPLVCGMVCWWSAAVVHIYGLYPLPGGIIPAFAWGGLATGLVVCAVFGCRIAGGFYRARSQLVLAVYFCCTFFSYAFTMGVPILVPLPGIALGFYIGRRIAHAGAGLDEGRKQAKATALIAAGVTGLFGACSILLASLDNSLAGNISGMLGLELERGAILAGAVLLLPMLIGVQFVLTRLSVRLSRGLLE